MGGPIPCAGHLRTLLLGCAGFALAIGLPGAAAAQAAAGPGATLGEIVVTAQKRQQNLQDVPIAVTALGAEALQVNRVANIADLSALAPNVTVRSGPGGNSVPTFTVRGLVSFGSTPGADKSVSTYVDGVYVGPARGSIFDFAEIERIEMLRGPQGTLFGRNVTAGAVSVITRDPPGRFGVRQELTVGNYSQFRSKTRVDLPTWGPLSASVSYVHSQRHGDIRNLGAGQRWDRTGVTGQPAILVSPKHLGDRNVESVLAALKFAPNADFSIVYKYDYAQTHATPEGVSTVGLFPAGLGAAGATLTTILATQPTPVVLNTAARRPDAVNNWWSTPTYTRTYGHSITARIQIDDHLNFKDILAYRAVYGWSHYELDGLGGLVNTQPALGPIGAPYILTSVSGVTRAEQWSNEAQLNYNSKLLTLTVGGLYYHEFTFQGPPVGFPSSVVGRVIPGGVLTPVYPAVSQSYNWLTSAAAYIQAEVHVTPSLDLVGGARITRDRKTGVQYNPGPLTLDYLKAKPSYLAGVNYKPTERTLVYVKYSNAFVSGGAVGPVAFQPETANSWEAGGKADWLDRRLRTNLSVFRVKYAHIQSPQSGRNFGFPTIPTIIVDQGEGIAKGAELEVAALPVRGLTLQATLGYTDMRYTTMNPILGTTQTFVPAYRARYTSNLSAQYDSEPVLGEARLRLRADANFISRQRLDANANPLAPAFLPLQSEPASWIVNGRAAIFDIPVKNGRAEVAAWVRNLTNNRLPMYASFFLYAAVTNFNPARTFGVDVSFDF